ncbi:MAG: type II secretion system protein [Planctomycetota bacterium]
MYKPNESALGRRVSCRGFTLLELLVVIAIIGLMIGMLIPSLQRSMQAASDSACKQHLRELGHLLEYYRIENKGWIPMSPEASRSWRPTSDTGVWFSKLSLEDSTVLSCPSDPYQYQFQQVNHRLNRPAAADYVSYGINSFLMTFGRGMLANLDRFHQKRPLDMILLGDLGPDDLTPMNRGSSAGPPTPLRNAAQLAWDDGFDPFARQLIRPWVTLRHGDGINMYTLDGGVREARTRELFRIRARTFYPNCASGGCTLCNDMRLPHYSFARSSLYWWTGPVPIPSE